MLHEIFQSLSILSALHVVPYYQWTREATGILDHLLGGIPYCLTPHGNVFLGERQLEDIQPGKGCLQAHLDHQGGILRFDRQAQYLFAKYYGSNADLFGYTLGVYESGIQEKMALLEVEQCVFHERERAACLFFKPDRQLSDTLLKKNLIVHYDGLPDMKAGTISNWNVDNLINCALILALLKKEGATGKFYGLLSLNEESEQEGMRGFLSDLADKRLFFINLDAIDRTLSLHNIDDEPYQHAYGIRMEQSGVKLDQFMGSSLVKHVEREYLAKIPPDHCEAHIMQSRLHPFLAIFLKIAHCQNGIMQKKFTAEQIAIEDFSPYVEFVQHIMGKIIAPVPSIYFSGLTGYSGAEQAGTIHLIDHVTAIQDIFTQCRTFAEYLHDGISKLRTIYEQYALPLPNLPAERFEEVKEQILHGQFPEIQTSRIYRWKEKILNELARLFEQKVTIQDQAVTVVKIVLANFNGIFLSRMRRILFSLEKISEQELDLLLIHELVHYLTSDVWSSQNMSPVRKEYYNEGLAIALSQKLSDSTLADALYMTEEELLPYMENRTQLAGWFEEYASGNMCTYFNGSYHQYFHKKSLPEPFTATGQQYQRYGYVLAALETMELIDKGVYYDHVFCQPISECDRS